MSKKKKIKKALATAKSRGWKECADVMHVEMRNQVNRQEYLDSLKIEALEMEVSRILVENKKLKKEYAKFIELKNNLLYESDKMNFATRNLSKDLMSIVQKFLHIHESCERVNVKHAKREKKLRAVVR